MLPDEADHFQKAQTISFQKGNVNLPLGDEITEHPLLSVYLLKLSLLLFGDSTFSGRILFVLCNLFSLIFVHSLCRRFLSPKISIIVLLLLAFSEYHISVSFLTLETSLEFLFIPVIMYFFCDTIEKNKPINFIILGGVFGAGYLAKESIIVLIPVCILFLLTDQDRRKFLGYWQLYAGLILFVLLISPSLYWNMENNFANFKAHVFVIGGVGPSITGLTLYMGELITFFLKERDISVISSIEYHFMNWIMGIIAVTGVGYNIFNYKRNDALLINFCLYIFIFVTSVLCMIRIRNDLFLDNAWWAQIGFIPAIICTAQMLDRLMCRYRIMKYFFTLLMVYLAANSFTVIFPK